MRYLTFLVFSFVLSVASAQQNPELDALLLLTFDSEDSSDIYFKQARRLVKSRADSANYLYFKFFQKDRDKDGDSAYYYSNILLPKLDRLDSLERMRKLYSRLHYIELHRGQYEKALGHVNHAIKISERMKDTAMISLHLSDKSIIYHDFEDYARGVEEGKKAYRTMATASNIDYKYLIYANNATAINFDDWNKPDSALYYHFRNVELLKKVDDSLGFAFVYNNIGNTNLKQENYDEALKYINRALKINTLNKRDYNLATNYTNLATIAYHQNKYTLAEEYFEKAKFHADESGSIEKIRDVVQQEAWYYKKVGNFEKALERQEAFYTLRDSVFNSERAATFAEMETRYETEKKERELAVTRADLAESELRVKKKNLLIYGGFGLALLLGVLGYLVYNQQKLKNRQLRKESELKTALAKIETQNVLQEQRLRISRDLHDNIGSQLTFIISSLDSLKYGLKDKGSAMASKLSRISAFAGDTIYELRDTIWAMNKNSISFEDLQSRISNFIEKANTTNDLVEFTFHISESVSGSTVFTSVQGMNLYRIIQEAVNNALKYAAAAHIAVHIEKASDAYQIRIEDDGIGFDTNGETEGNGLKNMQKRARDIGAELEIDSEAGRGTVVKLQFVSTPK